MSKVRIGVAFRLVGGLIAITIFAITTSILAIFGFSRSQDSFQVIAKLEMPRLVNAAELARQSESLVAFAPALDGANNQLVRRIVAYRMKDQIALLETLAAGLLEAGIDAGDLERLREFKSDLVVNLERIDGLVKRRLDADLEGDRMIRTVLGIDKRLRTAEAAVAPEPVDTSSNVSVWKTSVQEAVSLMLAGQSIRTPASLAQARKATAVAFGRADTIFKSLPGVVTAKLRPLHDNIRRLAVGEDTIFDARAKRIALDLRVQGGLSRNRVISQKFIAVVSNMFFEIQDDIRKRVDQHNLLISNRSRILMAISVLCVFCAGTVFFYVNGSVVRRLKLLQRSMSSHVAGRPVEIPTTGTDEIADMARSLEFFVDAISRREALISEARRRLTDAIESINEGFSLYDSDDRLVVANSRYRELLYAGDEDAVEAGQSFETIIRRAAEQGNIEIAKGRVDDWVVERMAQHRDPGEPHLQHRSDGHWIQISERKTDDGGTVAVYTDVTELRRAEEATRKNEAFLTAVLDNMPAAVVLRDRNGRFIRVNRQYEKFFSVTSEAACGKTLNEIYPKAKAEEYAALDRAILESQKSICTELTITQSDGELYTDSTGFPIFDAAGEVVAIGRIDHDITEHKKAEQALREKTEYLQLTEVIARAANEAISVKAALQIALDQVCSHTGWPVGHAYLLDETTDELVPSGIWHLDDAKAFDKFRNVTEATRYAASVGLPGRVLASSQPAWIFDVTKDPNFPRARLETEIGVRAGAAFPVLVGSKVAAVLEFFSTEAVEAYAPLLDVMAQIGTQLGRAIERERAEMRIKENLHRLNQDLQSARELQLSMLPKQLPTRLTEGQVRFAANIRPARTVCGDFYDVFEIGDRHLGMMIADVSGKGIKSALYMARAHTIFGAIAKRGGRPANVLGQLNEALQGDDDIAMYVTMFYGTLDISTGVFTFANAGHHPPFLIGPNSDVQQLESPQGTAVGLIPNLSYEERSLELAPGAAVFCFTDGVIDARNELGENFSEAKLAKALAQSDINADDLIAMVFQDLDAFTADTPQFDDVTCVVMERLTGTRTAI